MIFKVPSKQNHSMNRWKPQWVRNRVQEMVNWFKPETVSSVWGTISSFTLARSIKATEISPLGQITACRKQPCKEKEQLDGSSESFSTCSCSLRTLTRHLQELHQQHPIWTPCMWISTYQLSWEEKKKDCAHLKDRNKIQCIPQNQTCSL